MRIQRCYAKNRTLQHPTSQPGGLGGRLPVEDESEMWTPTSSPLTSSGTPKASNLISCFHEILIYLEDDSDKQCIEIHDLCSEELMLF